MKTNLLLLIIPTLLIFSSIFYLVNFDSSSLQNNQDSNEDENYGEKVIFTYKARGNFEVNLYSRLVVPKQEYLKSSKPPVALIIAGSGPTDLNCNNFINKKLLYTNTYLDLAKELEKQGIATVRYNKRELLPSYNVPFQNEEDMVFDDFAEDAAEIIKQLTATGNYSSYFILGHSEGSGLGMLAITKFLKKGDVQGFVSLEGAGFNARQILSWQLEPQLPADVFLEVEEFMRLLQEGKIPNCFPLMEQYHLCDHGALFRPSILPYLSSWFQFYPQKTFSEMTFLENLIVQGSTDIQVGEENAEVLQKANEETANNILFHGMNHILKEAPEDRTLNIATYHDPSLPLFEGLAEQLGKFILVNAKN